MSDGEPQKNRGTVIALYVMALVLVLVITVNLVLLLTQERGNRNAVSRMRSLQVNHNTDDLAGYCLALTHSSNSYVGTQQRTSILNRLASPLASSATWYVTNRIALAWDHLRFGETSEAGNILVETLGYDSENDNEFQTELLEAAVINHLKMGELHNCLSPSGGLICTLPLDDAYVHTDTLPSQNAIKYLTIWLSIEPDNLKARWLMHIAHMTLGTYPEGVDEKYLLPPEELESDYDIGRFDNIAADVGLYTLDLAGGSIIEDFDNDGLLDIMVSTWNPCESMRYFHNDGNGLFSDYTSRAGLDDQLGGLNITQTDYNNDGWMDILVMRGGWMLQDGQMRRSLLRNNGDGTFTDVTHDAGLAFPAYPSQSASWADFDNDGDLDLFSCNESMMDEGIIVFPSQLFANNGDGTFTDIGLSAGVENLRYCKGSAWGDFDNDNDPDLYVSNFGQENRLYKNNGDGTFTDISESLGVREPVNSFATWFWDYDNDGWLDIFVAGYGDDITDVAADYFGIPNDGTFPKLYRNNGSGGFTDVTRQTDLERVHLTMGANFGELDNDGFQDFYLGTGYPTFDAIGPNIMYRNKQGQGFDDVTFSGGFGHLQKGHGIAFGDLDRDGDQDIFAQMGGFYPSDAFSNALYHNPGHGNRWLSVKLVGKESNRAAIGARIRVDVTEGSTTRSVHNQVNSGSSFGASSLEQEIGLGQAEKIERLEVFWPTSGITQVLSDVPLDSHLEIQEGDDDYRVLDMPSIRFR